MSNHRELRNFAKGGDAGEFSLWDETDTNEPINGLFGSRRDKALQPGSNTIARRILYVLLCNIESLSKLTEKYEMAQETTKLWVAKTKPDGIVAKLTNTEDSPIGYPLYRGQFWWSVFVSALLSPNASLELKRYREIEESSPPGWNFDESLDHVNSGNVLSWHQFCMVQARLAYELLIFCDMKTYLDGKNELNCFYELDEINRNPLIPNKAYAMLCVLRDHIDGDRSMQIRLAKHKFAKIRYSPEYWVHDYIKLLCQYRTEMRLVGVDVPESDLFEKVKTEYMVHHTTAHPTDGYGEEHHKLTQVLERLEQGANPNTLDEKLRMAWNNFKTFKKHQDALYQKYRGRVKRKEPPKHWDMSRILDKSNRDSGRLTIHKAALQDSDSDTLSDNNLFTDSSTDDDSELDEHIERYSLKAMSQRERARAKKSKRMNELKTEHTKGSSYWTANRAANMKPENGWNLRHKNHDNRRVHFRDKRDLSSKLDSIKHTATTRDTLFVWLGRCTGGRREDVRTVE